MSRYIDAEKLALKWMLSSPKQRETFRQIIDQEPTADVVEVRHGEWKKVSEKYPRYVCTACNRLYNNKNYNYCPCCGAKMDEPENRHIQCGELDHPTEKGGVNNEKN